MAETQSYVLGHSDRELARLEQQAAFFADATRDVLLRAGIVAGSRVLDLGCGVGDVSSIAAELVGPTGHVTGLDISAEAVSTASARLRAQGMSNADFVVCPIETFDRYSEFDAVIGRFILVHSQDPQDLIRQFLPKLAPGTVIAFIEMDMSSAAALPPLLLLGECIARIVDVYRRTGRECDTGSKLYSIFRACDLKPSLVGHTRIAGGGEAAGIAFVTESVRSLMPYMDKLGIASPEEIGIDSLRERLHEEAQTGDHCIFYPRVIGAWATT